MNISTIARSRLRDRRKTVDRQPGGSTKPLPTNAEFCAIVMSAFGRGKAGECLGICEPDVEPVSSLTPYEANEIYRTFEEVSPSLDDADKAWIAECFSHEFKCELARNGVSPAGQHEIYSNWLADAQDSFTTRGGAHTCAIETGDLGHQMAESR